MQYGQENKVIDHKLKLLLIVKQILPRKCLENSMENMQTDVGCKGLNVTSQIITQKMPINQNAWKTLGHLAPRA